jgi:hypothetical protein
MTTPSTNFADDLNAAASLLQSVADTDPDRCGPGIRLHCLAAADHLRAAGARPEHIDPHIIEVAIRSAMAHLGRLPRALFATDQVVAGADAAQTALERAQETAAEP